MRLPAKRLHLTEDCLALRRNLDRKIGVKQFAGDWARLPTGEPGMIFVRGAALWLGAAGLLAACGGGSGELHPAANATVSAVGSSEPGRASSDREVAALTLLARQEAAGNGDPEVRTASYVEGTIRNAALRVLNAGQADIGGSEPVTVVVMTGHFIAYGASVPPGRKPPTGTVLSFTYDESIGRVMDFGLDSSPADLSSLGSVGTLHLG
jgi:hypothetical protein